MLGQVTITVDGRTVFAELGANLLDTLLDQGVYVPHLCHVAQGNQTGFACRLCFVMVAGIEKPVCACEVMVSDGMLVTTGTKRCKRLATRALTLLASQHTVTILGSPYQPRGADGGTVGAVIDAFPETRVADGDDTAIIALLPRL